MAAEKEETPMSAAEREMECRRRVESILQLHPQNQSTDLIPFQSSYGRMNDQAPSDDRELGKQILETGEASAPNHTNRSSHATQRPWQRSNFQIQEKRQKRPMPYSIGFSSPLKPKTRPYSASSGRTSAADRLGLVTNSISNPNPSPSGQLAALNGQSMKPMNIFCGVCKVYCWTYFNFRQHISGRKHKNKLKGDEHPVCELCGIWCTDERNLKMHLDGRKHKVKMLNSRLLEQRRMSA